jgi:septal ring factor EnvC (AmiA/AmiB activator)
MPHTSASFDLAFEECNRKLDQSLRDLEDHTAKVKAETLRLKAAIHHLEETIPRENKHANRHHQVHVRHVNHVQMIKRTVWHTSTKITDLRNHLRHDEEEVLRAVNRVIGKLANEMPSWARNFSWMMQHHP